MKTLFIPAESKLNISLKDLPKLPKNLAVVYSIQYKKQAEQVKNILSETHHITNFLQVLGCSKPEFPKNTKAVLLLSDGKFHAVSLAQKIKLPIYMLSRDSFVRISKEDLQSLEKNKKVSYVRFLNAQKIGILISIKPGQQRFDRAVNLKKKLRSKNSYLFIANNIHAGEFENFPEIESWVNTACTRLDMSSPKIINLDDIRNIYKN
ncbi:MAG: diphthamide synthesis protein [archaeon]